MVHVSIKPDVLFYINDFPITNTLITSWLVMLVLIGLAVFLSKRMTSVPTRLQIAAETVIDGLLSFLTIIAGNRETAKRHFPLLATIFFFILLSNWLGIFPGVGTIGFWEEHHVEEEAVAEDVTEGVSESATETVLVETVDTNQTESILPAAEVAEETEVEHAAEGATEKMLVPLFRSANSDLNITLAFALIVVTFSHVIGMSAIGAAHHTQKFFSLKNPINFFVGILEFLGEFSKIVSFSFRLFGNIFAGEVLLVIISFLVPYLVPIPFLGLELFVGVVQAGIFAVLGMMFFVAMEQAPAH